MASLKSPCEQECTLGECMLSGVISNSHVGVLNDCMKMLKREQVTPYNANGHIYLGIISKSLCCHSSISFGDSFFCQNPKKIKQYLDNQQSLDSLK